MNNVDDLKQKICNQLIDQIGHKYSLEIKMLCYFDPEVVKCIERYYYCDEKNYNITCIEIAMIMIVLILTNINMFEEYTMIFFAMLIIMIVHGVYTNYVIHKMYDNLLIGIANRVK